MQPAFGLDMELYLCQGRGAFFNWLKETSDGQGCISPEGTLFSIVMKVRYSLVATCDPPVISIAGTSYHKQARRAVVWPPTSTCEWKEENFLLHATWHVAGTEQLFENGCGHSEQNQGPHPKLKAPPQKTLVL